MTTPRKATRADNDACLELFSDVPMRGELELSTQRQPDFFALYEQQKAAAHTWVGDDERGGLMGMASAIVRDGWLDGRPQRVGYLGDLRVRFDRGRTFGRSFGAYFEELCRDAQCTNFYTSILASNHAAKAALVRRSKRRPEQPVYVPLREITAVSVQLTGRRVVKSDVDVRTATESDVALIASTLHESHRTRAFGYRYDEGEFQHRLAHWPGFTLENTLLAFEGARLVGVTTLWDPSPVKRYRVHAYNGSMKWVKRGFNLAAKVMRWPALPEPGGEFRYAYLSNLWVSDAPVLRALVEHAYTRLQPKGFHFFTFELARVDPLSTALRGFMVRRLDFDLYGVTPASAPREAWPSGLTGFEIALA